jgi:hypothetical protein
MAESKTKSNAPVAAREQLDEMEHPGGDPADLEQRAKDQEKAQSDALNSTLTSPGAKDTEKLQADASDAPAAARAGTSRLTPTRGGLIDSASRRSGSDALEGHFVRIDLNDKGVKDAYKSVGLDDHAGDYGVYLEPATLNSDTGIPETAIVRLRDDTNARVTVPYEALRPAASGGR